MIGWMLFVFALAAFAAPAGSEALGPVEIGSGVVVAPPGGWALAADSEAVGPQGAAFEKAGATVIFAAGGWSGGTEELLADQLTQLEAEFDSFDALPAVPFSAAGGVPGHVSLFTGAADSGRLEGEVAALAEGGTGVVMFAIAPFGQLRRVQGDLDEMLDTVVIPR